MSKKMAQKSVREEKKPKYKFTRGIIFWGADTIMRVFISVVVLTFIVSIGIPYSQTLLFRIASIIWIFEGVTKVVERVDE